MSENAAAWLGLPSIRFGVSTKNIIRVFPRRTRATPDDDLVRVKCGPGLFDFEADVAEIHVSVSFTYDKSYAEYLAEQWRGVAPVSIGGPAYLSPGEDFVPGRYLKRGYVITSRGCPNRCWFCSVPIREGNNVRELPITDGWNVLDDNLLACSDDHIKAVFQMLSRQKRCIEFTGGLESARLADWHIDGLTKLKPKQMFFAYDTPNDLEPLVLAGRKLIDAGFTRASHTLRCYVLIGYPGDTFDRATRRLKETISAGFMPMAMLFKPNTGQTTLEWRHFQRQFARPALMGAKQHGGVV